MAITPTSAYKDELNKKGSNTPNTIIEVTLDSGVEKWGFHDGGFDDVKAILKSVTPLQNKINTKKGYSTRGQMTIVISGRDEIKRIIKNNFLFNREVLRKDGYLREGFLYSDYAPTFPGKVIDWDRKKDELTVVIGDNLMANSKLKLPVENDSKTQIIDFNDTNIVDATVDLLGASSEVTGTDANIYTCILDHVSDTSNKPITGADWRTYWKRGGSTGGAWVTATSYKIRINIPATRLDVAKFESERDLWLAGVKTGRVLHKPESVNKLISQLQQEFNSFIIDDGEKLSFKVFAPSVPGEAIQEYTDNVHIEEDSLSMESGYEDDFYNRVVYYFDYDESGSDGTENYESHAIFVDQSSHDEIEHGVTRTKEIKGRWLRSLTFDQPVNTTGVSIYHATRANGAGVGVLTYNSGANTLTWTPFGGTVGDTVTLNEDGDYQLFGSDTTKAIRVTVKVSDLPGGNTTDNITFTSLSAEAHALQVVQKILNRFRDPAASIKFKINMNHGVYESEFIKPTDTKNITTDEAFYKGVDSFAQEPMMITSMKPNYSKNVFDIEAIQTKLYKRYGFIAPAGYPDYPSATDAEREYAFIGDVNNMVDAGVENGYVIW